MLANKDLYAEIEKLETICAKLEEQGSVAEAAILKSNLLTLKLLHSLRTNMVVIMKHYGIKLVESPKKPTSEVQK